MTAKSTSLINTCKTMRAAGKSYEDIATATGRCKDHIRRVCCLNGCGYSPGEIADRQRTNISSIPDEELKRIIESGINDSSVAKITGLSPATIRNKRKAFGIIRNRFYQKNKSPASLSDPPG